MRTAPNIIGGTPPVHAVIGAIKALSASDRILLFRHLAHMKSIEETGFAVIPTAILDFMRKFSESLKDHCVESLGIVSDLSKQLSQRTVKPRFAERDAEIVRLHDEEGKSFGQIPRLLIQINPAWCGDDGKQLTRDAAKQAYYRLKK